MSTIPPNLKKEGYPCARNYEENLYMEIFIINQRKGIYAPHLIESVSESYFENIQKLLQPHLDKLAKIWLPFSVSK